MTAIDRTEIVLVLQASGSRYTLDTVLDDYDRWADWHAITYPAELVPSFRSWLNASGWLE